MVQTAENHTLLTNMYIIMCEVIYSYTLIKPHCLFYEHVLVVRYVIYASYLVTSVPTPHRKKYSNTNK